MKQQHLILSIVWLAFGFILLLADGMKVSQNEMVAVQAFIIANIWIPK